MSDANDTTRPLKPDDERREPADDQVQPDVIRMRRDSLGRDVVHNTSNESFPASDPPSWSGSSSVPNDRDAPPTGEQAGWTVEREVAPSEAVDDGSGPLEQTSDPGTELPVPPEDALQG